MFKSVLALISLMSLSAFAGQTCFQADSQLPSHLPSQICFEQMTVEQFTTNYFVTVDGGLLKGRYLARVLSQNADHSVSLAFRFNIHNEMVSGCGYGESTDAVVHATALNGEIAAETVTISLETTSMNDVCHSEPLTQTVPFHQVH